MKLASHYTKASVLISLSVLIISALVYYITINQIARQQLDGDLSEEVAEFLDYVNQNQQLPKPVHFDEDQTTVVKTGLQQFDTRFFDTPFYSKREKKSVAGRSVSFLAKVRNQNFIITISESRENTEYLVQIISIITLILAAVLLTVLVITNKYVLKGLWKPFYGVLKQVQGFNAADPDKITVTSSNVDEFKQLSDAVAKMSARVTDDYQGLKSFTENASHEIMTPLSVITSKLDILIQDETLRPDQYAQITDLYAAANRLSRLNQSLLLLVKIDNDLLHDTEQLNIKDIIIEKFRQFQEMIQNKNIDSDFVMDDVKIIASRYLIDVLINNLFSNAIRHNKEFGHIKIRLTNEKLTFQNPGHAPALDEQRIFDRFYKGKSSEGTGLGLAIIKTICTRYGYEISYRYVNDLHCFSIRF